MLSMNATAAPSFEFGRLSFGAASLGNLYRAISDDEARETLEAAWDAGIRYFDTAPHYGLGVSERRLGAFLATKPRGDFVVSSKVGRLLEPTPMESAEKDSAWFDVPATARRVWDYTEAGIRRSLADSLERLGLNRVDILYLHDPEQYGETDDVPRALEALTRMRDEGLVSAVGVGSADVSLLRESIRIADLDLLMVSNRYTLLDSSARAALAPECLQRGIGIVNAAVFNSGLLATPVPAVNSHYEYGPVPPDVLAKAERMATICEAHGVELPTAALQYSLRDPAVRTIVVGAGSSGQVRQNHERMLVPIPDDLWSDLEREGLVPA
jgi:D-threo-aldose 1-dehydrogenase